MQQNTSHVRITVIHVSKKVDETIMFKSYVRKFTWKVGGSVRWCLGRAGRRRIRQQVTECLRLHTWTDTGLVVLSDIDIAVKNVEQLELRQVCKGNGGCSNTGLVNLVGFRHDSGFSGWNTVTVEVAWFAKAVASVLVFDANDGFLVGATETLTLSLGLVLSIQNLSIFRVGEVLELEKGRVVRSYRGENSASTNLTEGSCEMITMSVVVVRIHVGVAQIQSADEIDGARIVKGSDIHGVEHDTLAVRTESKRDGLALITAVCGCRFRFGEISLLLVLLLRLLLLSTDTSLSDEWQEGKKGDRLEHDYNISSK